MVQNSRHFFGHIPFPKNEKVWCKFVPCTTHLLGFPNTSDSESYKKTGAESYPAPVSIWLFSVNYFTSSNVIGTGYQVLSVLWYNYGTKSGIFPIIWPAYLQRTLCKSTKNIRNSVQFWCFYFTPSGCPLCPIHPEYPAAFRVAPFRKTSTAFRVSIGFDWLHRCSMGVQRWELLSLVGCCWLG